MPRRHISGFGVRHRRLGTPGSALPSPPGCVDHVGKTTAPAYAAIGKGTPGYAATFPPSHGGPGAMPQGFICLPPVTHEGGGELASPYNLTTGGLCRQLFPTPSGTVTGPAKISSSHAGSSNASVGQYGLRSSVAECPTRGSWRRNEPSWTRSTGQSSRA